MRDLCSPCRVHPALHAGQLCSRRQIRCKIGHDVVTLSINTDTIQVKADHYFSKTGLGAQGGLKGVSATATLKIKGEEEG